MQTKMQFRPISHSWVAVHPNPQGVIQFIGGAFFGTFGPMFFYRFLLQSLFDSGYTIVILPFNFTFNHYVEAGFLIKEQYAILPELVRIASRTPGYKYDIYLKETNFYWLGHSIGCKYISLLEGFSALPENEQDREKFIQNLVKKNAEAVIADIEVLIQQLQWEIKQAIELIKVYTGKEITINNIFIKNQESVLLAPVNSGTESAIPQPIAGIVDALGLGVKPTPSLTFDLIKKSNLFNLLGVVSFRADKIAKSTVQWFEETFAKPKTADGKANPYYRPDFNNYWLKDQRGGHLRPLGLRVGNTVINFPDFFRIPLFESANQRFQGFEFLVIQLLQDVKKKGLESEKKSSQH
ncbi:MAG TPA: DUF1350 family protein [Nostocaceae cyanobacterium]|nr:DUF1350 family protein [Nostocaceae cyanobacterium]